MNISPPTMTIVNHHICTACKSNLPTPGRWAWALGDGSRGELCLDCAALSPVERAARVVERGKRDTAVPKVYDRMSYAEYLQTPHWRYFKAEAYAHYKKQCYLCHAQPGDGVQIELHHNTYERLGAELISDVIPLCRDCHQAYEDYKRGRNL